MIRTFVIGIAMLSAACSSNLSRGRDLFLHAHYPGAKRELARGEREYTSMASNKRAEYALYRALTHGALGDLDARDQWLREAEASDHECNQCLRADDRARLRLLIEQADWDARRAAVTENSR